MNKTEALVVSPAAQYARAHRLGFAMADEFVRPQLTDATRRSGSLSHAMVPRIRFPAIRILQNCECSVWQCSVLIQPFPVDMLTLAGA